MSGETLGWVDVSTDLLREALHAPFNAHIVGARFDFDRRTVGLLFDSPDLPATEGTIPTYSPTVTREQAVWRWNVESEPSGLGSDCGGPR
jgi:hypothetical protein